MSRACKCLAVIFLAGAGAARPAGWTPAVEVQHDFKRCVAYRARLAGEYLVIEAVHEPGWHTVAMDNTRRAQEKLAGRPALGVDTPTSFQVTQGLEVNGPWLQSPPKDFSRPELQLFTWGFEGRALFAARVRKTGGGPARIAVGGQACTDTICKKVEVEITLPLNGGGAADFDPRALVQVR